MMLARPLLQRLHLLDDDLELRVGAQRHLRRGGLDDARRVHERDGAPSRLTGYGEAWSEPRKLSPLYFLSSLSLMSDCAERAEKAEAREP